MVNAREALGEGEPGEIRVVLEAEEVEEPPPGAEGGGPWVRISVSDTGEGMSEEIRQRIFDPFFTTKGPDEGNGLGLASVFGIVQDHDGWIDVESTEGAGSTFRVHLPLLDEALPFRRD